MNQQEQQGGEGPALQQQQQQQDNGLGPDVVAQLQLQEQLQQYHQAQEQQQQLLVQLQVRDAERRMFRQLQDNDLLEYTYRGNGFFTLEEEGQRVADLGVALPKATNMRKLSIELLWDAQNSHEARLDSQIRAFAPVRQYIQTSDTLRDFSISCKVVHATDITRRDWKELMASFVHAIVENPKLEKVTWDGVFVDDLRQLCCGDYVKTHNPKFELQLNNITNETLTGLTEFLAADDWYLKKLRLHSFDGGDGQQEFVDGYHLQIPFLQSLTNNTNLQSLSITGSLVHLSILHPFKIQEVTSQMKGLRELYVQCDQVHKYYSDTRCSPSSERQLLLVGLKANKSLYRFECNFGKESFRFQSQIQFICVRNMLQASAIGKEFDFPDDVFHNIAAFLV